MLNLNILILCLTILIPLLLNVGPFYTLNEFYEFKRDIFRQGIKGAFRGRILDLRIATDLVENIACLQPSSHRIDIVNDLVSGWTLGYASFRPALQQVSDFLGFSHALNRNNSKSYYDNLCKSGKCHVAHEKLATFIEKASRQTEKQNPFLKYDDIIISTSNLNDLCRLSSLANLQQVGNRVHIIALSNGYPEFNATDFDNALAHSQKLASEMLLQTFPQFLKHSYQLKAWIELFSHLKTIVKSIKTTSFLWLQKYVTNPLVCASLQKNKYHLPNCELASVEHESGTIPCSKKMKAWLEREGWHIETIHIKRVTSIPYIEFIYIQAKVKDKSGLFWWL